MNNSENRTMWGGMMEDLCSRCGEHVDITYTSKRRIEDMPEGWDGE